MSENSTSEIAAGYRRSGYLEIPTRAAVPATAKGQAGKKKYTELIQCFLENDDDDERGRTRKSLGNPDTNHHQTNSYSV